MENFLIFRQMFYDKKLLNNSSEISFFTETNDDDESATRMTEDQAVSWLFNNLEIKQFLLEEFFEDTNQVNLFIGLKEPFTHQNKKPGDIDLLLVDSNEPDKSVAFECKRVKAVVIDNEVSKINNIEKIKHGIIQVNKYQSLGFHQSYLMIIILDDGRKSNIPNTFFRSTNTNSLTKIYHIPWNHPLNNDVGVVYINVNQITGSNVNKTVGIGICIDKRAKPLEQTKEMTNKIKDLLKTKNK